MRKRLNTFHHRCIRTILGISNRQQWSERITMAEVRRRWGDEETVREKVQKRRLEWLGHLARMPDHRLPKVMLFSWLPQPRPRCGSRKRWRDVVRKDLRNVEVGEHEWYAEASRSRAGWRVLCQVGLVNGREARTSQASTVVRDVVCELCSRSFRRKVTSRGTNVWTRDRSQCANSEVQHSVHSARSGLRAEGASSPLMYTRSLMPLKNLSIRRLATLFGARVAM